MDRCCPSPGTRDWSPRGLHRRFSFNWMCARIPLVLPRTEVPARARSLCGPFRPGVAAWPRRDAADGKFYLMACATSESLSDLATGYRGAWVPVGCAISIRNDRWCTPHRRISESLLGEESRVPGDFPQMTVGVLEIAGVPAPKGILTICSPAFRADPMTASTPSLLLTLWPIESLVGLCSYLEIPAS